MRTRFMTIAALVAAGAMTVNAQAPQQPPQPSAPQPPSAQRPTGDTTQRAAAAQTAQVVTITGCLKEEKNVPGLTPNPAERVGISEDYILTEVKMAQSSKVSGLALGSKYEIEGLDDDTLKKHLNHQVELTGTIGGTATASDTTPNFNATAIKMVAAACPAAQ